MTKFNPAIEDNPNMNLESPESMQPFVFKSKGEKLIGTFFKASGNEQKPTVLLLHGFPGNENNFDIAHAVKRSGFNAIVFHYRGSWGSGGEFSISNSLEDVSSALEYIMREDISHKLGIDSNNMILIGHSMGGFLAFLTALKYPQIKHVAFLAGFNFGFFMDYLLHNPQFVEATMDGLSQGSMLLKGTDGDKMYNEILSNKDEWNLLKILPQLSEKKILLVGAEFDYVSPLKLHHIPIVDGLIKVGADLTSVIYNSGHSFSSSRIKLTKEIINWLKNL